VAESPRIAVSGPATAPPSRAELERVFRLKFGEPDAAGWGPRMRWRFGHFGPDEHYEAIVDRLVGPGTVWLDVGCGRHVFPSNPRLATELSERCAVLVGVDPDATLAENPWVHERVAAPIDAFASERRFDVVTLRMVAEHIEDPESVTRRLADCTRAGGHVVVYTVNRYSPVPLLTGLVPFAWRHPIKKFLWGTESKDTFPTRFRMNSRRRLARLFDAAGFDEALFRRLDDCRSTGRFRALQNLELGLCRALNAVGCRYPENCLLGVYRRRGSGVA
jgi:SAM-dependent methyltransferase